MQATGENATDQETTVTVRCPGHVRDAVGTHQFEVTFAGDTLREFLEAVFAEYDVEDLLVAETDTGTTARGWAPRPEALPGTWRTNLEGEQTKAYARVLINGRFNEHQGGFDAVRSDGDRVALVEPFIFCC